MYELSLAGPWDFRFEDEQAWRTLDVPGCWESLADVPKDRSGPALYRRTIEIPAAWAGRRLWLHFDAVSYDCSVMVDGQEVGQHTGLWDAFEVEITSAVGTSQRVEVLVRVEKPASLTKGPDSPAVSGRFPMRETLVGFLPYVWGHIFGGIWQDVRLVATGPVVLEQIYAGGNAAGEVQIEAALSAPASVACTILDPAGAVVYEATQQGEAALSFTTTLVDPQLWAPRHPALYTARLRPDGGEAVEVRFGLRTVRAEGATILLNEQPIYPRMALSWGWYEDVLNSNPGPERVRADFARLQAMGYNGVKLCLWFPPHYYFELADELGMLLWVELPMWLPRPTPFFRTQTPLEYERLLREARNHPAVILYTLGCELNSEIGADILEPIYALAKRFAGDALVRDNSGSGEAYGGLLNEYADFYDYHFYTDIQFMRDLLDRFAPRWRPAMPWLFGEFCDFDTFRDLRRFYAANGGERPWWTLTDTEQNPQGARWQFDIVEIEARLRANGFWERGAELEGISERQGLLHRKWTLELIRTYREIAGYVVTGEADTPISTAGMWDDTGRPKFDASRFAAGNSDIVLLAGWDKRRAWIIGGDRLVSWDTWSYRTGDVVRAHLIASHYGVSTGTARVEWQVADSEGDVLASGAATTKAVLEPGALRELTIAEFPVPTIVAPMQVTLHATAQIGDETATNAWPLWFFPAEPWTSIAPRIVLLDATRRLEDFAQIAPGLCTTLDGADLAIATTWTPELDTWVAAGGRAILLQGADGQGPIPHLPMPFWREAVKLLERHGAWGDFPHEGWTDLQFFGCAPDHALASDATALQVAPILRRVDARTMAVHDYAVEVVWGAGRLIVTTLRFEGGLGEQPRGISRNTAASYLLNCWARYFLGGELEPTTPA